MGPYQVLQVAPDADEREVKRAYAKLLKKTRPDENAAAFQRLREAYEYCLARARYSMAAPAPLMLAEIDDPGAAPPGDPEDGMDGADAEGGTGAGHPTATRRVHAVPPPQGHPQETVAPMSLPERPFDAGAFVSDLHSLLAVPDPRRMRQWLYAQEALYSLELKHVLRPVVVRALHDAPIIADDHVAAALIEFFGLDSLDRDGTSAQAQAVLEARKRASLLDRAVRRVQDPGRPWIERLIGRDLRSTVNPLRRFCLLLVPTVPSRVGGLLAHLRGIDPRLRHPWLDAGSIAFWDHALDMRALRRPRVVGALMRAIVWPAVFFAVLMLLARQEDRMLLLRAYGGWAVSLAGLWLAYALIRMGWGRTIRWANQRWRLPDGAFSSLLAVTLGAALSWVPAVGPLPASIGLLFGYLRPLRDRPGWVAGMVLISLTVLVFCMWVATERTALAFMPEQRLALVFSLSALPLPLQVWMTRSNRLSRWSHWVMPAFALAWAAAAMALMAL